MATARGARRTWLAIAAERREFNGILKRFGKSSKLDWPAEFSREAIWKGDRWLLVANGPGPRLAVKALDQRLEVNGMISTGFCGALDPALRVGDIVVSGSGTCPAVGDGSTPIRGDIVSSDRVAVTAAEKEVLRARTGAIAVEMEAAGLAHQANLWGVPFYCIRAVSDIAAEDLPLDFNQYRDGEGRFCRTRIALAALARPFAAIPPLLRLNRNCQLAADALGEFFANCQF